MARHTEPSRVAVVVSFAAYRAARGDVRRTPQPAGSRLLAWRRSALQNAEHRRRMLRHLAEVTSVKRRPGARD